MEHETSLEQILEKLRKKSRPDQLEGMAGFGIDTKKRLGVSIPELRKLSKEIGRNHELALNLWDTNIDDAMILASMIDIPEKVTEPQMDRWILDVNSWDVCDQLCMNLFENTEFVLKKIDEWSSRKEEFVKRTAFSLIACLAWHKKEKPDSYFEKFFPLIIKASTDERNFVKKAVNWALRNIGKRNKYLNIQAIKTANEIKNINTKPSRWIASDAIRELESEKIQKRF